MSQQQQSWPSEIRLSKDRKTLTVTFEDGRSYALPAEFLRVESPSAEVQGHGPNEKKLIAGKMDVEIIKVEPVGHYAVKLVFDDMHDTGIYGWDLLASMGEGYAMQWQAYLDALAAKGMSREPLRRRSSPV